MSGTASPLPSLEARRRRAADGAARRPRHSFCCQPANPTCRTRNTAQQSQGAHGSGVTPARARSAGAAPPSDERRSRPRRRRRARRGSSGRAPRTRGGPRPRGRRGGRTCRTRRRAGRRPRPSGRRHGAGRTRAGRGGPRPARSPARRRRRGRSSPTRGDAPLVAADHDVAVDAGDRVRSVAHRVAR